MLMILYVFLHPVMSGQWSVVKMFKKQMYLFIPYLSIGIRDRSFSVVTRVWDGWLRNHGLIPSRERDFFFSISTLAQGHTLPPVQEYRLLFHHEKSECVADDSPPSSVEVKNAWSCTSAPPYVFMVQSLIQPLFKD
jgi:hypothetical protein